MFRKTFIILCCFIGLSGCADNEEPTPMIVYSPKDITPVPPIVERSKNPTSRIVDKNIPSDWYPPLGLERRWEAIIIHHSATRNGNSAIFDKQHREEHHWDGVAYDFVIGNGTDSGDGEVEVTFRWREQITGAHCKTPNNWGNEKGIGICLVGNFDYTYPTSRQMWSLTKLVRFLQNRYRIPKWRIYGHGTTPGARVTDCPGRLFPMAGFKARLGP
jgi:N-acetylmuramoyl-L-alanine amidase